MRDPEVERVAERLEAVYSKAVRKTHEWFELTKRDQPSYRITILALMKMFVALMRGDADE